MSNEVNDPRLFNLNKGITQNSPQKGSSQAGGLSGNLTAEIQRYLRTGQKPAPNNPSTQKPTVQGDRPFIFSQTNTAQAGQDYSLKTKSGREIQGTLVHNSDGTYTFTARGAFLTVHTYTFKNKEDLENNRPSMMSEGLRVTEYKYNSNNTIAQITIKVGDTTISDEKFNSEGIPVYKRAYNRNNKLISETVYESKDANTVVGTKYDADRKPVSTIEIKYENGKKVSAKTFDAKTNTLKSEASYINGNLSQLVNYAKDGTTIERQIEYYPETGGIKTYTQYNPDGSIRQQRTRENAPDGKFDSSSQVGEGDCYLMATINAIREMPGGQEMLANLITTSTDENGKKVYTVTFPGAKLAAEGLMTDNAVDNSKMYITGTYTFTEDELNAILQQSGSNYSVGDADTILLEAAMEKYKNEASKTINENGLKTTGAAGSRTGQNPSNILEGGQMYDSMFILTGKASRVFEGSKSTKLTLDDKSLRNGTINIVGKIHGEELKAVSEVDGQITQNRTEMDDLLDQVMNSGNRKILATCAFNISRDGKSIGGHAFTIKSVTADTVVIVNPWYPDEELVMSREDFKEAVTSLCITDIDSNKPPQNVGAERVTNNGTSGKQRPQTRPHNPVKKDGAPDNPKPKVGPSTASPEQIKRTSDGLVRIVKKQK